MLLAATLLTLVPIVTAAAPAGTRDGPAPAVLSAQSLPAGVYDASMCVTVGAGPANCGPVVADLDARQRVDVRVSDILYRLEPYADQLGVSMFHGTMQVDGFFARHRWQGRTLQFDDPEKGTRYEITLGTRRFDPP